MKLSKVKYLDSLQVYRGLAALFVVIHHNAASIRYYHNFDSSILNFAGQIGKYGVDFFFVLSGFIISYTSISKVNVKGTLEKYIKNRFLRIYVPYLPIGVFVYLVYMFLPSISNANREISTLTSLTLIPHGKPALSVAWTLTFELLFYIFYSLRFIGKNVFRISLFLWVSLIILVNLFVPETTINNGALYQLITSPYNIEFLLGVLLSYVYIKRIKINFNLNIFILLALGISFLYIVGYEVNFFNFLPNLMFSLFVLFMMYFTVTHKKISLGSKNLFMIIGNASYSIYLVHNNLQAFIVRFFPKIHLEFRVVLIVFISLIGSCVTGYIYYFIFEKKLTNIFKKKLIK